jgi:UDP-N-acetylmuramate dehydrogenase
MQSFRGTLIKDASLTRLNTWRVGGRAKQLYKPTDINDLSLFLKTLASDDEPLWLGLGSNVLLRDGGIENTVILTHGSIQEITLLDNRSFRAEAGATCAKAAKFCVKNNFDFLIFLISFKHFELHSV